MATIDELIVELGFDFDPEGLKEFQNGLDDTIDLAKRFVGTIAAASAAVTAFVVATSAATDEQGKMANQIGISTEDLDAWRHAATLAGGTADGMSNSLEQLSIRASEASRGTGSGVEAFGLLGISALDAQGDLKDTTQLMLEVSSAMQGMDRAKQIELADKLGLRDSIRLLQAGPRAIRAMTDEAKELGVVTAEDAEISANFNDALADKLQIMRQVSRLINRELAPFLTEQLKLTKEWWKANRDIIEQKLPEWIDKGVRVIKALALVAGLFISLKLVTTIFTLIKAFRGLQVAVLVTNATVAALPVIIAAAAAALVLLAQDAKKFFEGGESAIGRLIERFPEWEGAINVVASALATLWDLMVMVIEGWRELLNLVAEISTDGIKQFGKDVLAIFTFIIDDIKDKFFDMFSSVLDAGKEKLSALGDIVKDKLSVIPFSDKFLGNNTSEVVRNLGGFAQPQASTSNLVNNRTSSNVVNNSIGSVPITINESQTPADTAKEIQAQLQEAAQNVSSPVAL